MDPIRIGLLGCGRHGQRYLRHLLDDVQGALPVALWRRDRASAEELARATGVDACGSAEELVRRDDVDAVVIVTPPGRHRLELELCAEAGRPVLVEKPLVARWDEALELRERFAAGPPVMLAHTLRYHPALRAARRRQREMGALHRIRLAQRLEPSDLPWQRDAAMAGGGSITLTGVHLFDLLRWLMGRTPDRVGCTLRAVEGHPLENVFDACFEYEDEGLLGATEVSKFSASRSGLLEILGTEGQLRVDYGEGVLHRVRGQRVEELERPGSPPTIPALLEDFVRVVRGEIEAPIDLVDGVESMRMIEACYRSHREGRRVRLEEI